MAGPLFDAQKTITVYSKGGRVRYIPGKGIVKN